MFKELWTTECVNDEPCTKLITRTRTHTRAVQDRHVLLMLSQVVLNTNSEFV